MEFLTKKTGAFLETPDTMICTPALMNLALLQAGCYSPRPCVQYLTNIDEGQNIKSKNVKNN